MTIDTWIGNELVTVDVDDAWIEVFLYWDARVDTAVAAEIATATVNILKREATS